MVREGSSPTREPIDGAWGDALGSLSKSTDYLVAGEKTGKSRLTAAEKHGVQVIDEAGLEALFSGSLR